MATTVYDVLNTINDNASAEYQTRVPQATQDNIVSVGNSILSYQATKNEFIDALVNRIAMTLVKNKSYTNPLAEFKNGMLEYGDSIEEVFIDIINAQTFNQDDAVDTLFKKNLPDVKTYFHKVNREDQYPVTISEKNLRRAFLSDRNMQDFISKVITSMYTSDAYDEFIHMKHLLFTHSDHMYPVKVSNVTNEATAKSFLEAIRSMGDKLSFLSNKYNPAGVYTSTSAEDLVIFMDTERKASIDVQALAQAFNISKADVNNRIIVLDDFGGLKNVQAIVCDKSLLMVYDVLFEMTNQYNPKGLYWNYFLTHWQLLSVSNFANVVIFYADGVLSVVVTGAETATQNSTVTLTATVTADTGISKDVNWFVDNATDSTTVISSAGVLTVGELETVGNILTVRAVSKFNNDEVGTLAITIV